MTATKDVLKTIRETLGEEAKNGKWRPAPGDALHDCAFLRAGFRSWGLEAPDKTWKLVLTQLDFASRDPSAVLEVYAPNHDMAFGDLGWLVFSRSVSINGGLNFRHAVTDLHNALGAGEADWGRRISYLIARAREANAGSSNGTFSTRARPVLASPPPFMFVGQVREGRTMSLFGPGSAGKTTIADGLIASACSGTEIIPGWEPSRPYTTCILDWDEGKEEEEVRLSAICNAYDVELGAGYHYKRMSRPLHDIADEVGAYIVANKIEFLIVSPVGRATRSFGDNLTAPVDELYEILRTFGTTNLLIDHVTGANVAGGAEREFGSVRKRDNVRGSYSLYAQSESVGERVVVIRNTKPDALSFRKPPQAVRIVYDPPNPITSIYDTITFLEDEVIEQGGYPAPTRAPVMGGTAMRVVLHKALLVRHMTIEEMAAQTGQKPSSIKTVLYRYRDTQKKPSDRWFGRLSSGSWEALPLPEGE